MSLKNIANWIVARAKEPSTWVGIGTVVAGVGAQQLGGEIAQYGQIGAAVLGGGLIAHPSSAPTFI